MLLIWNSYLTGTPFLNNNAKFWSTYFSKYSSIYVKMLTIIYLKLIWIFFTYVFFLILGKLNVNFSTFVCFSTWKLELSPPALLSRRWNQPWEWATIPGCSQDELGSSPLARLADHQALGLWCVGWVGDVVLFAKLSHRDVLQLILSVSESI